MTCKRDPATARPHTHAGAHAMPTVSAPSTAREQIEEAGQSPTLDDYMRRDPASLTEEEFRDIVRLQREERATFQVKEDKKQKGGDDG